MQSLEHIGSFQTWPVEFGRDGNPTFPPQVDALVEACLTATDLLVVSHGWNNDEDEANALYRELLGNLAGIPFAAGAARQMIVLRVYWPSKRFADADLIPGGAAALAEPWRPVVELIDSLLEDMSRPGAPADDADRRKALEALRGLADRLDEDDHAQEEFVRLVRFLFSAHANDEEEVLQAAFFETSPPELLQLLGRRFKPEQRPGGAASLSILQDAEIPEGQIAASLGNLFGGVFNGARNLLNLFTYYEMKERAGTVGGTGLADALRRARVANPDLRLHLCGHSFGGRLVTAAAASLASMDGETPGVSSLTLLQAAFSHNGFGQKYDGQHDGFFRKVMAGGAMRGPIVVTHSKLDLAVGLAYPLASRLRNQVASGLGDADDPYGAIGRNGALHLADHELDPREAHLRPTTETYGPFEAGRVYNLDGVPFIKGHSFVRGPEVAAALRHAILSAS